MTDNELLLAISNMMDTKLEPVNKEIQGLRGEIKEVREDVKVLKEDVDDLKKDVKVLKEDVDDLKIRVKKIEITQENQILPQLNTIQACYTSTYDRYRVGVDEHEAMKQDISILKKVVTEHSEKLQMLA